MNAIIILAAGSSSRLGQPKQNLLVKGQTLLQASISHAKTVCDTILVVLGANRDVIEFSIKDQPVDILYNPQWAQGMASSIRTAIEKMQQAHPEISAVTIMLCDQPHVDAHVLQKLADAAVKSDKGIVACAYKHIVGAPALFKCRYFPYLLALKGHDGAKKLLDQHADDLLTVDFPLGSVDIDTLNDWQRFTTN